MNDKNTQVVEEECLVNSDLTDFRLIEKECVRSRILKAAVDSFGDHEDDE